MLPRFLDSIVSEGFVKHAKIPNIHIFVLIVTMNEFGGLCDIELGVYWREALLVFIFIFEGRLAPKEGSRA